MLTHSAPVELSQFSASHYTECTIDSSKPTAGAAYQIPDQKLFLKGRDVFSVE